LTRCPKKFGDYLLFTSAPILTRLSLLTGHLFRMAYEREHTDELGDVLDKMTYSKLSGELRDVFDKRK
jgi:hypothetical protein